MEGKGAGAVIILSATDHQETLHQAEWISFAGIIGKSYPGMIHTEGIMARCEVCFRRCEIAEGRTGFCGARGVRDGVVRAVNYGKITSLALDPIEKKPLSRFFPGSRILSVGSYGCNLRCPFCQNYEISWSDEAWRYERRAKSMLPEELVDLAAGLRSSGNIGIAFTYNEPLIGYEFVLDTARLVHDRGMKNVLVSNGMAADLAESGEE